MEYAFWKKKKRKERLPYIRAAYRTRAYALHQVDPKDGHMINEREIVQCLNWERMWHSFDL